MSYLSDQLTDDGETLLWRFSPDAYNKLLDERVDRIIELITQLIQPNNLPYNVCIEKHENY